MNTRCENRATRKNKYTRHTPKDLAMPNIPWRPRVILPGRNFRLPVQAIDDNIALTAEHFETIATRWCERDTARYYYLRSPQKQGDYTLTATHNGDTAKTTIQVRTLDNLRQPHTYNGAQWPRRWPLGQNYHPTKTRQTLQNDPKSEHLNQENPRLLVIPTRPCTLVATTARGTAQSALCQLPSGLSKLRHRHLQIQRLLSLGTQPSALRFQIEMPPLRLRLSQQ